MAKKDQKNDKKKGKAEKGKTGPTPGAFVSQQRQTARQSIETLTPQLEALATQSLGLVTSYGGQWTALLKTFLESKNYSAEQWLLDGAALSIAHWSKPLETLAQFLSSTAAPGLTSGVAPTLAASKFITFNLDQASQAADPIAIIVDTETHAAVKKGKATVMALGSKDHTIPAANIRLSVSGKKTFVSLVGLGDLKLKPGRFSGPIRVIKTAGKKQVGPKSVGVAHLQIGPVSGG